MNRDDKRASFDWYAASVATGITGPFSIWALWVLLNPNYIAIVLIAAAFLSLVFWGFGKIRIADVLDAQAGGADRETK